MCDISYIQSDGQFAIEIDLGENVASDRIWIGHEVAVGFTYDPDPERGIQYTVHSHGHLAKVQQWADRTRFAAHKARFMGLPEELCTSLVFEPYVVTTDQWDPADLTHIINSTGSLGGVLERMGIQFL